MLLVGQIVARHPFGVSRVTRPWRACVLALAAAAAGLGGAAHAGEASDEFDRQLFKQRFEADIAFREAAIHVAWGASPICDHTTEIEPFVLWSTHTLKRSLSQREAKLFKQATGMDEQWRVAWLDEAAPDELQIGDEVVAINQRKLQGSGTRINMLALLRGNSPVGTDDQAFWDVLLQAREEAKAGKPLVLTLKNGREFKVPTQAGCAGSVVAPPFDTEPDRFERKGSQRAKIPANALMAAQGRDEYRWLAAFGTYFQASTQALGRQRDAENAGTAFTVGRVLTMALPGAGMLLSVVEEQAQRSIAIDGVVGGADLFANEVVTALGGNPAAGLELNQRLQAQGIAADVVIMGPLRRSNAELHVQKLKAIQAAKDKAEREQAEREGADNAVPPGGNPAPTTTP